MTDDWMRPDSGKEFNRCKDINDSFGVSVTEVSVNVTFLMYGIRPFSYFYR